jgi:hypothetical protein
MAVHDEHRRSAVAEQAADWYWPDGHAAVVQAWQLLPLKKKLLAHELQVWSLAVVQVSLVQLAIAVHDEHARSAVAEQAADWYWPAAHAPEHGTQLLPLK